MNGNELKEWLIKIGLTKRDLEKVHRIVDGDPNIALYMSQLARFKRFPEIINFMYSRGWDGDAFMTILINECKGSTFMMARKIIMIIEKRNSLPKIIHNKDWR